MNSEELKKLYDRKYFLEKVEGHKEFKSRSLHHKKKYILDLINVKNKSVFDVGFGRGELLQECYNRGAFKCYGIDYSLAAYEIAKEYCNKNIELKLCGLNNIIYIINEIKMINFVFMVDVIEHINDEELFLFLTDLRYALNDKSEIIISTPVDIKLGDYKGMHINQWDGNKINKMFSLFFNTVEINIYKGYDYIIRCKNRKLF